MSGRRSNVLDIREVLRRVRLGESDRAIAEALAISRKTVQKYRMRRVAGAMMCSSSVPTRCWPP